MKRFTNYLTAVTLGVLTLFAMSCDNTEDLIPTTPDDEYDVVLKVKEDSTNSTPDVEFDVEATTGSTISAKVTFVNTEGDGMKRLYITRNIMGTGEVAYEPLENVDLRADGAIGLEASQSDEFSFEFDLEVPDTITNGTVVYTFWTTHGNGDMRDMTQRLAAGPGTITLNFGNAQDPDADDAAVKSYTAKMLSAPLEDGSSYTFISLVDGELYKIDDGAEYASLWDFGYYYTNANGAALASTAHYETAFPFVDVDGIAGTTDLNNAYFALSDQTSEDFDAVSVAGDLNFVSAGTSEKITGLQEGDIIEFEDNYGKKGLIRVVNIQGTFNSGDFIEIDVKVQP